MRATQIVVYLNLRYKPNWYESEFSFSHIDTESDINSLRKRLLKESKYPISE